jgi:hypothetical protein
MTEHPAEQLPIDQFATLFIGELVTQIFEVKPEVTDAALQLQAALVVADALGIDADKQRKDRIRPLASVKRDILATDVTEDDYNEQVKAALAKLGTKGYSVLQGVPRLGELLSNDNAGLVKDENGEIIENKPVISEDARNAALLFQAAARLAVNNISDLAEPRIFDNDPPALKTAQKAVLGKIQAQKAGSYTNEMRQADSEAAQQAMQAFDELYELYKQSMTSQSLVTGLTEKAEEIIKQLSR